MIATASRCIKYGNTAIEFELIRSNRKTLGISVHPNQSVTVKAPIHAEQEEIDRRVENHARWILKQQQFFSQFEPRTPPRLYVSGETHLYLGRQYRLKIQSCPQSSVKLKGRYFYIETPHPDDPETTRKLLNDWYLGRARLKFEERLDICFQRFKRLECDCPTLKIRRLSSRWGSISSTGSMTLNCGLIRASLRCIDYVITHELCHLKHPNHSPTFYNFFSSVMPDWKARKLELEQMLI